MTAIAATEPGVQWRLFIRALADEIDGLTTVAERDDMLRGAGGRLARLVPLSAADTVGGLQIEMNDSLATLGWGQVKLSVDTAARMLVIRHMAMPRIGSAGEPPGTWMSALLEGLYTNWIGLHAAETQFTARRTSVTGQSVTLRYGRQA